MTPHRKFIAAVLAIGALLAIPLVAGAAHWPGFGGDAGHSGNQPVEQAAMPTGFLYRQDDAGDPRTSVVTTAGPSTADQFVSYGTFQAVANADNDIAAVHLRSLEDGAEKIAAAAQDVDGGSDDPDAFGPGVGGVTPVDTSSAAGAGQLFVVHNDTDSAAQTNNGCTLNPSTASGNDIAIAQFNEADGTKVRDVAVGAATEGLTPDCPARPDPVSADYTIQSSPVITPPLDESGRRVLFFTAAKAASPGRLFAIEIGNAGSKDATYDATAPDMRDIAGLNTKASPTIAYLRDPSRDTVIPYVVLSVNAAAGASDIITVKVDDIAENGPAVAIDVPGNPQTVSVPVTANGRLPGQDGSGATKAPALYAAYDNVNGTTTVRKFVQTGSNTVLTPAAGTTPTPVEGSPAPALALTEIASGDGVIEGKVVVTTGQNVIILDSETVTPVEHLADVDEGDTLFDPAVNGFGRSVALVSGNFAFVTNLEGAQFVLSLFDGERVPEADFTEHDANNTSDLGLGQPSLSRGFLQFLSDRGLFVYETTVIIPPPPPNDPPVPSFTITPNPARVGQVVTFDGTASTDPDGSIVRYEWDLDGNGTFETDRGTSPTAQATATQPGTFAVKLRVTDTAGESATLSKDLVVGANQPPVAVFSVTPAFGTVGSPVNYDASGSRDPDGAVARYEWDLDGNGSFETNSGTNPKTSRVYTSAGVINVRLRVTDNDGAAAESIRQVSITAKPDEGRKRPGISASVRPGRDRALPYRFRTSGRISPPSGVDRGDACAGRVTITVKVGRKTISRRTTAVRSDCRFRNTVSFRDRRRIGGATRLRFTVRFQGNKVLLPRSARTLTRLIG